MTVRDSQPPWKIVRDMYQLHGTREIVRDSQQPWDTVRDMEQLHGSGETVGDSQCNSYNRQ